AAERDHPRRSWRSDRKAATRLRSSAHCRPGTPGAHCDGCCGCDASAPVPARQDWRNGDRAGFQAQRDSWVIRSLFEPADTTQIAEIHPDEKGFPDNVFVRYEPPVTAVRTVVTVIPH